MANLDTTTSPSTLSSPKTEDSASSSENTPFHCERELKGLAEALFELTKTLNSEECFAGRAEAVLAQLSTVHHNFYELHNAIFDKVNWQRRNELYFTMTKRAPYRQTISKEELNSVLSKLGL